MKWQKCCCDLIPDLSELISQDLKPEFIANVKNKYNSLPDNEVKNILKDIAVALKVDLEIPEIQQQ